MNIDRLARDIHANAVEKGFWDYMYKNGSPDGDTFIFYGKQLAMIHSEVTEVLEAIRKTKGQDQVVEEFADIIIRVLDLYEGMRIRGDIQDSLHDVLQKKIAINTHRDKMHGVLG